MRPPDQILQSDLERSPSNDSEQNRNRVQAKPNSREKQWYDGSTPGHDAIETSNWTNSMRCWLELNDLAKCVQLMVNATTKEARAVFAVVEPSLSRHAGRLEPIASTLPGMVERAIA